MTKKAFTYSNNVLYFAGQPLLTARNETEARYRSDELNEQLRKHLEPAKPALDANGWSTAHAKHYESTRGMPRRHGFLWTEKEERDMVEGLKKGLTVSQIAVKHERELLAITMRIEKMTGQGQERKVGRMPASAPYGKSYVMENSALSKLLNHLEDPFYPDHFERPRAGFHRCFGEGLQGRFAAHRAAQAAQPGPAQRAG